MRVVSTLEKMTGKHSLRRELSGKDEAMKLSGEDDHRRTGQTETQSEHPMLKL